MTATQENKAAIQAPAEYIFTVKWTKQHSDEVGMTVISVPVGQEFSTYKVEIPALANDIVTLALPTDMLLIRIKGFVIHSPIGSVSVPMGQATADNRFAGIRYDGNLIVIENTQLYECVTTGTAARINWENQALMSEQPKTLVIEMAVTRVSPQVMQQLAKRIQVLQNECHTRGILLQEMRNSNSWRLMAPLRWGFAKIRTVRILVQSVIRDISLLFFRRPHPVKLHPLNEVENSNLQLIGDVPKGWVELQWRACVNEPQNLFLHMKLNNQLVQKIKMTSVDSENIIEHRAYLHISPSVNCLTISMNPAGGEALIEEMRLVPVSRITLLMQAVLSYSRQHTHYLSIRTLQKAWKLWCKSGIRGVWQKAKQLATTDHQYCAEDNAEYQAWLEEHKVSESDRTERQRQMELFAYKPRISIIVPVYNVDERWLRKCIESVQHQFYPNWELCIADDASPKPHVRKVLKEYEAADSRIKVAYRQQNGHISAASNSALELATGEYIALLDNDDELEPDALYENVKLINLHPEADMIYSDEDKISEEGKCYSPFFKPDWSPDTFLSQMYTCHFGVYRASLIRKIGGFRLGVEGSQDYDLVLRLTEHTDKIFHIPKILYHWRTIAESTAFSSDSKGYAYVAGQKAIQDALNRRGEGGKVKPVAHYPGQYRAHYPVSGRPLISIIIPTKDMAEMLERCLQSIFRKTTYNNFEVLVIDNGSVKQKTHELFSRWCKLEPERFRICQMNIPFNYSRLNNYGVSQANGELIVLLNNDVEVLTPNWLEEMAGQALRPSIGAVGTKLLYSDRTVQHAGVILGIVGPANHSHRGAPGDSPGYFGRLLISSNYAAVTGACLMIAKQKYLAVGGLDEELAVSYNDIDFCLRLYQAGFYNVVIAYVELFHYESYSRGLDVAPEKQQRLKDERTIMEQRWSSLIANDPFYNPNLTRDREDFSLRL